MSKNQADVNAEAPRPPKPQFTTTRRGPVTQRRAATSARLAREARQQRFAILSLIGVIALIVIVLAIGAFKEYIWDPAQPVATVNGTAIRTDVFNRYQKFQSYLLTNEINGLQTQISRLQADTKNKAANAAIISQFQQQLQLAQSNDTNIPAYTLQQMENTLMLTQAAAKIGQAPTPAQLTAQMLTIKKQAGGPAGYGTLLSSTGVNENDIRTYFAAQSVVQQNVTKHFEGTVAQLQPQAKARHILVGTKALAQKLLAQLKAGASFAVLAKKYSTDNGLQPGQVITGTAKLQAESQSSAFNGGWLRDPSAAFVANQPTWITPQTSYVKPVLDAILSMKINEIRIVQSQFGFHVIQVTAHGTRKLSKSEITSIQQQHGQQGYQTWQTTATDPAKNKVIPPSPYAQFPATTSQ